MGKRTNSRAAVLDAAEELVSEVGANHMSLDAVAARAGLSKGGLLYLFPSKVALLQGMVERYVERLEQPVGTKARRSKSAQAIGECRRLLAARLAAQREKKARTKDPKGSFSMIAAIAEQPDLLDPVRCAHMRIWQRLRKTSADPELALLAWLALEGLLWVELFATSPLTRAERARLMKRLERFADESERSTPGNGSALH